MATPRHSNQSVKYRRVGAPLPADKVKGTVGKVFCFQHANGSSKADVNSSEARQKANRKDKERASHLVAKANVREQVRHEKGSRKKVSGATEEARRNMSNSQETQPNAQLMVSLAEIGSHPVNPRTNRTLNTCRYRS